VIQIPRFISQVNVIGRVRRPGLIPYEPDRSLDYYIERAGGLAWRANDKDIFIVKGITGMPIEKQKLDKVDAGDTIVIPTKREKKFWPVFRDAMVVLGNVATLYLVIDQAVK
jgi:protein involved in polysaccharide export with SLBB domain